MKVKDHVITIEIGNVQRVYKGILRPSGWGFTLRDNTIQPAQFVTIIYKTESEAEYARKQIQAAVANAI